MKLVVISPPENRPDEIEIVGRMFAAGLERYHVRKPGFTLAEQQDWLDRLPAEWRSRIVLHQYHELVADFRLGGLHWREDALRVTPQSFRARRGGEEPGLRSRSCHDLGSLRSSLGVFDSVFFGPLFPSISKPGYGPSASPAGEALGAVLGMRSDAERATSVLALGGINLSTASRALALGFDGVAVLGAVWLAENPLAAYRDLTDFCRRAAIFRTAHLGRHFRSAAGSISGARC